MICQYQILSYIPCFNISKDLIQHYWIWNKISNYLHHKIMVPTYLIHKMVTQIFNLEKQQSFCYSDPDVCLFLEYKVDIENCFFKVQWYIIIYA